MGASAGPSTCFLWPLRDRLLECISFCVFAILDVVDQVLCPLFALLDSILDTEPAVCYCYNEVSEPKWSRQLASPDKELTGNSSSPQSWYRTCDTLYAASRRSSKPRLHLLSLHRSLSSTQTNSLDECVRKKLTEAEAMAVVAGSRPQECRWGTGVAIAVSRIRSGFTKLTKQSLATNLAQSRVSKQVARWSDCGCQRCMSCQSDGEQFLHVHIDDKDFVASEGSDTNVKIAESNVIFLHGFLSSSSFWTDTVMPSLPKSVRSNYRLFAVDIMGFGQSPKPSTSLYTIADHIDMIKKSVIEPNGIQSFHLVAHSMGCTIALALGAHYLSSLKSITLVAPPYFPATPGTPQSAHMMQQLAARSVWPLITFGSSVMSLYEHIGRVVCFIVCKNHRLWEPALFFIHSKLLRKRLPLSFLTDFTRHTHHAAWHIFHNTICNGGSSADHCLKVLQEAGRRVRVIHGTADTVIPYSGSVNMSQRYSNVLLTTVAAASHGTVVFGREEKLVKELAEEILAKKSDLR